MTDRTIDECLSYENPDKLVLTTTSQIVGAYDHKVLLQYLRKHKKRLPDPVNSITWLNEVSGLDAISATDYQIDLIENALDRGDSIRSQSTNP